MKIQTQWISLAVLTAALPVLQAQAINWDGGGADNLWSNPTNWADDNIPDNNTESAAFQGGANVAINVDTNFTIGYYVDGYGGEGFTNTLYGAGVLTIDRAQNWWPCILNATGNGGGTLRLNNDMIISNSVGGTTLVRNDNSSGNVTLFDTASSLTINTTLQTADGAGGSILFNGVLASSLANLVIGSDNVTFGAGHDSSSFGRDIVFNEDSKLAVDGGTVLAAYRKFQVNGTGSELELNGENAMNGPNIIVAAANDFLVDINADQDNIGYLKFDSGTLTLDLDEAVTNVVFKDTSAQTWGTGSLVIHNFRPDVIRIGTDSAGLSAAQFAQTTAYDHTGAEVVDLAIDSDGYLTGTVTIGPGAVDVGEIEIGVINGGSDFTISWMSTNGASYGVSNTTDLVSGSWTLLTNGLIGSGNAMTFTNAADGAQNFFIVFSE